MDLLVPYLNDLVDGYIQKIAIVGDEDKSMGIMR